MTGAWDRHRIASNHRRFILDKKPGKFKVQFSHKI
jgi:hypothetical protein